MKAETRAYLSIALAVMIGLFSLHAALAFTSAGVAFLTPAGIAASVSVAVARISGGSLPTGVVLSPPVVYWIVFGLLVAILAAAWWFIARWWGHRHPHRVKVDGTLGRMQVRAQNERTGKGPRPIGLIDGHPFYPTFEDSFAVLALSGAGKTMRFVVQMVVHAIGAVVTTSTRMDVFLLTAWQRSRRGRVLVFAPEYGILQRWKGRVGWNIVSGCENPAVAMERADALVAARPSARDRRTPASSPSQPRPCCAVCCTPRRSATCRPRSPTRCATWSPGCVTSTTTPRTRSSNAPPTRWWNASG